MRASMLLILVLSMACASPTIEPSVISTELLRYGVFELMPGRPQHIETTDRIRCKLGVAFGVTYRIRFPEGSRGKLPVAIAWHHPEINAPHLGVTGTVFIAPSPPSIPRGAASITSEGLWSFGDPVELVPGRYEFILSLQGSGDVLLRQAFEVTGC